MKLTLDTTTEQDKAITLLNQQSNSGGTLAQVCDVGIALLKGRGFIEIYASDGDQPSNAETIARVNGELK